jgi:hypothetical protein
MLNRSNGDNPSPVPPPVKLEIFRVKPETEWYVRTLSDQLAGIYTHHVKNRSEYCHHVEAKCLFHKTKRFWKGYAPVEVYVQDGDFWVGTILEITPNLEQDFRPHFARGQVWRVWREAVTKASKPPIRGQLKEERDPKTFPPPFDIRPRLLNLYGVEEMILNVKNPAGDRQFMTPTMDAPPVDLAGGAHDLPSTEEVQSFMSKLRERGFVSPEKPSKNGKGHS